VREVLRDRAEHDGRQSLQVLADSSHSQGEVQEGWVLGRLIQDLNNHCVIAQV
jgi:hypothetical protein